MKKLTLETLKADLEQAITLRRADIARECNYLQQDVVHMREQAEVGQPVFPSDLHSAFFKIHSLTMEIKTLQDVLRCPEFRKGKT